MSDTMHKSVLSGLCFFLLFWLTVAPAVVDAETGFLRTYQSVSTANFVVKAMAVHESSGDFIMGGYYSGESIFGGTSVVAQGPSDAFLMRTDASAGSRWIRQIRGAGESDGVQQVFGVAVDQAGNSYVTGESTGAAYIDADSSGAAALSGTGTFVFVAKYDDQGNLAWHQEASSDLQEVRTRSVAVDGSGNVYIAGWFFGTSASFGSIDAVGGGGFTPFVAKYNAAGTIQWVQTGDGLEAQIWAMIVDADGALTVAGNFYNTVQFGAFQLSSAGAADMFLVRYNADGTVQWAGRAGGTGDDLANGLAADNSGGVVVVGQFADTAIFGTGQVSSAGDRDAFVARYDVSGNVSWVTGFGGPGQDSARGIGVHPLGRIAVSGEFSDTVDLNGEALVSRGGTDALVAFFSPSGEIISALGGGGADNDMGRSVVWHGQQLAVAGGFKGAAVFGDMHLGTHSFFDAGELFFSLLGDEVPFSGIAGDFSGNGQIGLEDAISILQVLISGR